MRSHKDAEDGAVLPIVAVGMLVVLMIAAIVIDLGSTRAIRRDVRATTDSAATAAANDVKVSNNSDACATGLAYAFLNLGRAQPTGGQLSSACGSANMNVACDTTTTRREAVLTIGTTTVRFVNPVPETDPLMRGTAVGGGSSQTFVAASDGEACKRVGVQITMPQSRFFSGVVSSQARTLTVHSVARYNPSSIPGGSTPALVALNETACATVDAGSQGEINVRSLSDFPSLIYADSDGSACTGAGRIMVATNSAHIRAAMSGTLPGEIAWFSSPSKGFVTTSSNRVFGTLTDPEHYVGKLYARAERTTRNRPDQVYHCTNVPLTVTSPICPVSQDAVAPGLAALATVPSGYGTYSGSCSPSSIVIPAGDWYIPCPLFEVKNSTVNFQGGNLIFQGRLDVTSNGVLLVNAPAVTSIAAPSPVNGTRQSQLVVRGGVNITSNGTVSMAQTTVISGSGFELQGGGTLLWTPPSGPDLSVAGSRKGLLYWSESTASVNLQGGPNIAAAGVFFAGRGILSASGNGDIDLTKVQVWVDQVKLTGTPRLKMAADPANAISLSGPGSNLVR